MIFERFFEKRHIKAKIKFIYQKIWDAKLLREQLRAVREHIRQNYDYASEQLRGIKDALAKPDIAKDVKKQLEARQTEAEQRVEALKADIATADQKIEQTTNEITTHRSALPLFNNYLESL